MSIYGMKPQFTTYAGYQEWRKQWAKVYNELTNRIKKQKQMAQNKLKYAHQHEDNREKLRKLGEAKGPYHNPYWKQHEDARKVLLGMSVAARKLCTVLDEAKIRMGNITSMRKAMTEHRESFPIKIDACDRVEFHFNKKHLEFPWIPMWVLKSKGKTFYVDHVNALCPWTTREAPDNPSTKGSIRLRNCSLEIDAEGIATLQGI